MSRVANHKIISLLFRKEMRDIFRDRKSVMMMFFVPVILYPLIFFIAFIIVGTMQSGIGIQHYNVVIDGDDGGRLSDAILEVQRRDSGEGTSAEDAVEVDVSKADVGDIISGSNPEDTAEAVGTVGQALSSDTSELRNAAYELSIFDKSDYEVMVSDQIESYDEGEYIAASEDEEIRRMLDSEIIDAYVKYTDGEYHVYYISSITNSDFTERLVSEALDDLKETLTIEKLTEEGLDSKAILEPIDTETDDMATSEQSLGYLLGTIIPFMMIISLLVGVMTPAIDVTTGEKERGTLETLLMLPVSNTQIIVAKFFAVALVGIITTLLSIISMAGIGAYMLTLISESQAVSMGGLNVATFVPAILIAVPVLIVLSLFLTAVSMSVTCIAKSYKEANTYMSPIMIVVMLTGYVGFIPNIELDTKIAMIPVANVVLLIKNLLLFKVEVVTVMQVLFITAAYTGLIILLLGKLYQSESVLFDEGRNNLGLFEKRSNMKEGGVPSSGDGWFVGLVGLLLLIYVGGILQTKYGLLGVFESQLVLIALPIAMAVYMKKNMRDTFSLRLPNIYSKHAGINYMKRSSIVKSADGEAERQILDDAGNTVNKGKKLSGAVRAWTGSIVFGLGTILIGEAVAIIMTALLPSEGQMVSESIFGLMSGMPIWVWFVIAVTPGICEEMVFRGYLLSAFRSRYRIVAAVLLVAVFFGVYHTSILRFPTTALLGAAFAYIVYKTGSIIPGMILHCINNSIAVLGYYHEGWFEKYMPWILDETASVSTVLIVLGVGLMVVAVGVILLKKPLTFEKK